MMCQQWIKWCVFLAQNITDMHIVDIQKKVETSCSNIDVMLMCRNAHAVYLEFPQGERISIH